MSPPVVLRRKARAEFDDAIESCCGENDMSELPTDLLEAIPVGSVEVAKCWWASLSEVDRCQVAGMWDERLEFKFFTPGRGFLVGCTTERVSFHDSCDQVSRVEESEERACIPRCLASSLRGPW
jgi:hypothetical protein